jgi:hypothetical protein
MKKILVLALMLALTMNNAFARDAVVYFTNGFAHTYNNVPPSITKEQVMNRITFEAPDYAVAKIEFVEEDFWDTTAGKVVKWTLIVVGTAVAVKLVSGAIHAKGPCLTPTDRAANGSLCGGRAASVRPGGA